MPLTSGTGGSVAGGRRGVRGGDGVGRAGVEIALGVGESEDSDDVAEEEEEEGERIFVAVFMIFYTHMYI